MALFEADTFGGLLPCRPCFSKYYERFDGTIVKERVRGETMWTLLLSPKEKSAAMVPGLGRLAAINYAMIGLSRIDVRIVPTACSGPDIVPFDGAVGDVSTWGRSTAIESLQESPPTSVGYLARQGLLPGYQ